MNEVNDSRDPVRMTAQHRKLFDEIPLLALQD